MRLICSVLLAAVMIFGCARNPFPKPEQALRTSSGREISDDGDLAQLGAAIDEELLLLKASSSSADFRFGPVTVARAEYLQALGALAVELKSANTHGQKIDYLQRNFAMLEVYGDKRWGEVFITSYFEPVINGSLKPNARYSRALYAAPKELLTLELSNFNQKFKDERKYRGRVSGREFLPYYTRNEIDVLGRLNGRGLEICYVDPIDAFFMQIQGSGTVRLENGPDLRLVFAEKNGAEYQAIGKYLKEQISPKDVTLQSIEEYLRTLEPEKAQAVLDLNPSYVFFRKNEKPAITALGTSAVPGRTIATDRRYFPKGALGFMEFEKPIYGADGKLSWAKTARLVLDQDTGGAINGPGRVDLFWGRGDEAKKFAGQMKGRGRLYYLVPRSASLR